MNKYLDTQQLCRNASWYEYGMNYDYEAKFAKKVRTPFFYIILFNRLGAGLYCERYGTSLFFILHIMFHSRAKNLSFFIYSRLSTLSILAVCMTCFHMNQILA